MPRWTPEARAKQARKIREWQPWHDSTGPKTVVGKARSCENAIKHGMYSKLERPKYSASAMAIATQWRRRVLGKS